MERLGVVMALLLFFMMFTQPTFASEPSWAHAVPLKQGNSLTVSCHGLGPDRDVAIRLAIDQCRSLAVEQINGNFDVKTLSVETEQMAGFHQEVSAKHSVSGLACDIQNQHEEQVGESREAWIQCKFSLNKAKIAPIQSEEKFSANVQNEPRDEHIDSKRIIQSRNKHLIVSSVPHCQSMLIRGKLTRMVRCESNPQLLLVEPTDKEIIVRAQGYQPKHVTLSGNRELDAETETVDVYLERE